MDIVKKRKLPKASANPPRKIMDNADDIQTGQPKNPGAIIEAADGSGDNLPKMPGHSKKMITSGQDHRASVEMVDNDIQQYPLGQPKNTTATIEAADRNDDDLPKMPNQNKNTAKDRRVSLMTILRNSTNIHLGNLKIRLPSSKWLMEVMTSHLS